MFALSNRNIVLTTKNGDETFSVRKGALGDIPERFCETLYFDSLVKDGKIVPVKSHKDSDLHIAADSGERALEETIKRTRKK